MNSSLNVTIGKGKLAGKGVYAARDFKKGEPHVPNVEHFVAELATNES